MTKEQTIRAIKDLRIAVKTLEKQAREVLEEGCGSGDNELVIALNNLTDARHWLGEALGVLGVHDHYPEVDVNKDRKEFDKKLDHLVKVMAKFHDEVDKCFKAE
jgi:hypothetical protein